MCKCQVLYAQSSFPPRIEPLTDTPSLTPQGLRMDACHRSKCSKQARVWSGILMSGPPVTCKCILAAHHRRCLQGKVEEKLFLFSLIMWWKEPNKGLSVLSTSLIPPVWARHSVSLHSFLCSTQTVMHGPQKRSWVTAEHLAAPTHLWKAAQYVLFHVMQFIHRQNGLALKLKSLTGEKKRGSDFTDI